MGNLKGTSLEPVYIKHTFVTFTIINFANQLLSVCLTKIWSVFTWVTGQPSERYVLIDEDQEDKNGVELVSQLSGMCIQLSQLLGLLFNR